MLGLADDPGELRRRAMRAESRARPAPCGTYRRSPRAGSCRAGRAVDRRATACRRNRTRTPADPGSLLERPAGIIGLRHHEGEVGGLLPCCPHALCSQLWCWCRVRRRAADDPCDARHRRVRRRLRRDSRGFGRGRQRGARAVSRRRSQQPGCLAVEVFAQVGAPGVSPCSNPGAIRLHSMPAILVRSASYSRH